MKISIIHSLYKPFFRGGAEVVVEAIALGLINAGHEVQMVTLGRENESEVIDGVKVTRIKPFNLFNFIDINSQSIMKRAFWHVIDMVNIVQAQQVKKALADFQPELILTHNLKGLGYAIPRTIQILGVPIVHTIHDQQLLHPTGLAGEQLSFAAKMYATVCRWLFGNYQRVVFPSAAIKARYEQNHFFVNAKRLVLGNPLPYSVPELPKLETKETYDVLFLGQVEVYKGINELVEAVKNIQKPKLRLHVVGDGAALKQVQTIAVGDERIIFHGRLDHERLERLWPKIDLLVLPSQAWESFGMVVIEAYAHGVPVLVSKNGALPELVIEGQTGWVLNEVTSEAIANKVESIMTNACRLENMRILCQSKAKEFEVSQYLKRLLDFATM
ncbi:MAG: glycosyltransferase [Candidatus Buchananbacteria bacterium]|nr:glycosyltransferase [Candidatus Buchananbacteria bacterium]